MENNGKFVEKEKQYDREERERRERGEKQGYLTFTTYFPNPQKNWW
jgi:hypothetical protein